MSLLPAIILQVSQVVGQLRGRHPAPYFASRPLQPARGEWWKVSPTVQVLRSARVQGLDTDCGRSSPDMSRAAVSSKFPPRAKALSPESGQGVVLPTPAVLHQDANSNPHLHPLLTAALSIHVGRSSEPT